MRSDQSPRNADAFRSQLSSDRWIGVQQEAFQVAMDGGSLADSLGVLSRALAEQTAGTVRCAFYILDPKRQALTHIVGMPDGYAAAVDSFSVAPDSLACGLAIATGAPVLTGDVLEEPSWQQWNWLAREYGFRGCWSFPVETAAGRTVGSVAIYFEEPRHAGPKDVDLAKTIAKTAAIIIAHHQENTERVRSEERLRQFAEASSRVLWVADAAMTRTEYVSPAITSVFGTEPSELPRTPERWYPLILPEDRRSARHHFESARRGETVIHDFRIQRPSDGAVRWVRDTVFPLRDKSGAIERIGGIAEDVTESKLAAERQSMLIAEIQHRVRNILSMIRSTVRRTSMNQADVSEFVNGLMGRLDAMSRTQTILSRHPGQHIDLEEILREELLAQAADERHVEIAGPAALLPPKVAEVLTLGFHELASNSVMHGVLGGGGGKLKVVWSIDNRNEVEWLALRWSESGIRAPRTKKPTGFGTEFITKRLPYEIGGEASIEFAKERLVVEMRFPITDRASVFQTDSSNTRG